MELWDRLGTMAILLPRTIGQRSNRRSACPVQSFVFSKSNRLQARADVRGQVGRLSLFLFIDMVG